MGNATGWQFSGFTNITVGRVDGWQLSGFLNYADEVVRGHQIALINIAQNSRATPFGLLSYVHQNGYRRLELSTDEVNTTNLTFRTGVQRFYNIFTAGTSAELADTRVDVPLFTNQPGFFNVVSTGWIGFGAALRLCNP